MITPAPPSASRRSPIRVWSRRVLLLIATLALSVGLVAGVANHELADGNRFAAHANAVRMDDRVSDLIGVAISDQVIRYDQNLVALRPAIEAVLGALVRSSTFSPIIRAAIVQVHEAFTTRGSNQIVLRLADLSAVVVAALKTLAPDVASALPADLDVRLASIGGQDFTGQFVRLARVVDLLSWLCPLLALLAFATAWWLSRRRQRALALCGLGTAAAGALVAIFALIMSTVAAAKNRETLHGAIWSASWTELGPSVWRAAAITGAVGATIFAAAGAYLPQWSVASLGRRVLGWVRNPGTRPRPQLISGFALVAVGGLSVYRPLEVARTVAVLGGLALLTEGVGRISRVSATTPAAAEHEATTPAAAEHEATPEPAVPRRRWTVATIASVAAIGLVALLVVSAWPAANRVSAAPFISPDPNGCNGYAQLCARRYDQVSYVATHNSMSAADEPGWYIPEQPTGLVGQLDAGVRTLLIDTWYGQQTNRKGVIANAETDRPQALEEANSEYGAAVVQSALRVRSALNLTPRGPVQPYLCHALCELGSTPLVPALKGVQQWMSTHPREVVTLIIEDTVSPEDTATAIRQAGLLPYAHTQPPGQPWPTLGQMIDSGKRLEVFMQRRGGGTTYPWMLKAFEWIQDTPYDNSSPSALSCTVNRGSATDSLFLINNILNRFNTRVTDSSKINAFNALYPYASTCQTARDRLPNFIAVDYYNKGDVFSVVNRLNGVG